MARDGQSGVQDSLSCNGKVERLVFISTNKISEASTKTGYYCGAHFIRNEEDTKLVTGYSWPLDTNQWLINS